MTVNDLRSLSLDRFWGSVEKTAGCWLWTRGVNGRGYGQIRIHGFGRVYVHRVSWVLAHGALDDALDICHHCDTPRCVNPAHLFIGTHADNMRDMGQKGRAGRPRAALTHCKHGHVFTPANTRVSAKGHRSCRACHAQGQAARRQRLGEAYRQYVRQFRANRTDAQRDADRQSNRERTRERRARAKAGGQ